MAILYWTTVLIPRKRSSKTYSMKQPESLQELHVSLHYLYNEIKWESLQKRQDDHNATLFFKMKNNLVLHYLSSLVPPTVGNAFGIVFVTQTTSKPSTQKQLFILTNSCLLQLGTGMIFHVKPNKLTINSFKYFLARERERAPV